MKSNTSIHGWQDFVELCIASWVFVSPFTLGFIENVPASLSCMFIGAFIISLSIFGMARETPRIEWTTLCFSVLLIASPWLFAFSQISAAVFNVVISGTLLILFSVLAMLHEYNDMESSKQKTAPTN